MYLHVKDPKQPGSDFDMDVSKETHDKVRHKPHNLSAYNTQLCVLATDLSKKFISCIAVMALSRGKCEFII